MKATLFVGGGRITSALAAGLRLAGDKRVIAAYDRNPEKLRALRRESRVEIASDLKSAVEQADMLIVAVRPSSVAEILDQVAACKARTRPRLYVSLAAGVPLQKLRARIGPPACWARAMPSPVCRIARGLTALSYDRNVSSRDRKRVRELFEQVGQVLEIPESQFDAFTATFSSSHGYHALSTLARAAQDAGLDRKTALLAAAHALSDGIAYWRQSELGLAELLHEAATPGGTAAATMRGMGESGYERVVANGLKAGIRQARRNARG
jgi:pyrroline-5-carboxylate reductase